MDVWYDAATVFLTDFKPFPNSTYNYVVANMTNRDLLGPRSFASVLNSTKLTPEEQTRILAGAPFVDGKSTAKIFYTVTDYSDSLWLYNYNLYYSWNGCSNQAVALSFNGTDDVQNYIMCPSGVHEADLERMSVLVCKNDQKVKQIAYSQHAWTEVRDCQIEGQCLFDEATGNPVSYVALEGHGNYPENTQGLHVYYYMGSSMENFPLENVGGIYVGDRTGDDPERTFIPTPDNIVYIPPLWEIQSGQPGINPLTWEWAVYPGNWGAPLLQSPLTLECLNPTSTAYVSCNENSTIIKGIYSIAKILNLGDVIDGQEGVSSSFAIKVADNTSVVGYPDITGPLFRAFSYQYIAGNTAPILTQNVTLLTCPNDTIALEEIPTMTQLDASASTITSYLIGVTVGTLLFSIILICLLALPSILDKTTSVQEYVVTKYRKRKKSSSTADEEKYEEPSVDGGELATNSKKSDIFRALSMSSTRSSASAYLVNIDHILTTSQLRRLLVWGTFATCLFIAGLILTAIGVNAMFDRSILTVAAQRLNANSLADTLYWLTTGCLIFIVACDAVMFFLIFMFQPKRIQIRNWSIRNPLGGWKWFMNKALSILSLIVGLISLIIAICAVLFSLGLLISIIQLTTRVACNALFNISILGTSVQSVCIEISALNINICGWEALQACANVTTMTVRNIIIGSMLLLWCHILWMVIIMTSLESFRSHQVLLVEQKRKGGDNNYEESLQEQASDVSQLESSSVQD